MSVMSDISEGRDRVMYLQGKLEVAWRLREYGFNWDEIQYLTGLGDYCMRFLRGKRAFDFMEEDQSEIDGTKMPEKALRRVWHIE